MDADSNRPGNGADGHSPARDPSGHGSEPNPIGKPLPKTGQIMRAGLMPAARKVARAATPLVVAVKAAARAGSAAANRRMSSLATAVRWAARAASTRAAAVSVAAKEASATAKRKAAVRKETKRAASLAATARVAAKRKAAEQDAAVRRAARAAALQTSAERKAAALKAVVRRPARWRAVLRERANTKAAARAAARHESAVRRDAAKQAALRRATVLNEARRLAARRRAILRLVARDRARRIRRRRLLVVSAVAVLVVATGLAVGAYFVDRIPTPEQLELPESTTVYFSDGTTPMARLGTEFRTILGSDEMSSVVKQAIVAAEDRTFWTNDGIDFSAVLRAAWNNVTGGPTQGASTITQQYTRVAADLSGLTYARKARETMLAWKMDKKYSKEEILEFYLNTVPFGRGAYGIEAAAEAFFGKTARSAAPTGQQVTVAEAMVLASLVKQPEPDPDDPDGYPGYDPARGGRAAANSISRWEYIREGMVSLGFLTNAEAEELAYPHTVRALDSNLSQDGLDRPTGLVVSHVLSELRQSDPFKGKARDYIRNGGFQIVTTLDRRAQDVAEASADIRRSTAPAAVRGQPANWQAALVAVEPGTGRVLAYYGGNNGTGADHAGWFYDDDGNARGFGQHPPGSSFKVYGIAEALRQKISLWSQWDSPAVKEFPASGRTRGSKAGPVRNASTAECQPTCTLLEATVASLNVPFFDLTEKLGPANIIDMASRAGIDSMWADVKGHSGPIRVDLRGRAGSDLVATSASASASAASQGKFWTEVGIGQYGVTVLDHANGLATFAAGGKRAQEHFVREVTRHGVRVYAEALTQSDIGLSEQQVDELTWTLSQVRSAKLTNGWDAAGKTGTWQAGNSTTQNAHTWMVGYTKSLAVAVWLGTTDGKALTTKDGDDGVYGSTHAATIWRQFMIEATSALALDPKDRKFRVPRLATSPTPTAGP
jgi:membrane peptidoglycan carboxypeptidase